MRWIWMGLWLGCGLAQAGGILLLGDSLSAGYGLERPRDAWPARLQRRLHEEGYRLPLRNASITGETTAGALERLPDLLEQERPAVVIVELGGNDGLRAYPPARFRANLEAIVARAQQAGAKVLLLGIRLPPNYGRAYLKRFLAVFPRVARERGVPLVPNLLSGVDDVDAWMQADGVHPNDQAQARMLENMWPALVPLLILDTPP